MTAQLGSPPAMNSSKSWIGVEFNVVSYKEKLVSGLGRFVSILILILFSEDILLTSAVPLIASMETSAPQHLHFRRCVPLSPASSL